MSDSPYPSHPYQLFSKTDEGRYRALFEIAAVSIWEEDFSKVAPLLTNLKTAGIDDLRTHLHGHPEVVEEAVRRVKVVNVNRATLKLYGAENKEALLGPLSRLFKPETLPMFTEELVALAEGHAYFEAEGEIQTLTGEPRTVLFNVALPSVTGSWSCVLVTLTDLTERKQAEAAARESDARYRALAANLPAGAAFVVDHDLRFLLAEGQGLTKVGLSAGDFEGKALEEALGSDAARRHEAHYRQALSGQPFREEHTAGKRHYVSYGTPLRDAAGEVYAALAVSYDITERKLVEAERERLFAELTEERARLAQLSGTLERRVSERTGEVQALAAQLTLAEAKERARLAQVLHDSVQQQLYAVQFSLHNARRVAREHPAVLAALAETGGYLKEALSLSRTTTANLSPPVLHHEGLAEALRWLSSEMKRRYDLTVTLETHATRLDLHESVRVLLFNLVRELLFNVVKHAFTGEAAVVLKRTEGGLEITVSDAGRGFDPAVLDRRSQGTGFGLSGVRKRLSLFGGSLDLAAARGQGTRVTITVPAAALTLD